MSGAKGQGNASVKAVSHSREIVLCGVFAAITAVLSQISVPIGPVPISCSLIAVYLTGLLLPARAAVLAQAVYLLLGTIGVPVFAGFQSGATRLAGPTGGYLLVYPILAGLLAVCMVLYDRKLAGKAIAARAAYLTAILLLALLVCYAGGTAWFMVFSGNSFRQTLTLTVLPFLAGDAAKIILCVIFTISARARLIEVMRGKRSASR